MKNSFSTRRVPRKIGVDEEDLNASDNKEGTSEPTIVRPTSKPRKATSLRKSFKPGGSEDEEESTTGVTKPKSSKVSRIAIQRNADSRRSLLSGDAPTRHSGDDEDRPSYSAEYLKELKQSTPNTPRDLTTDASASDVDEVASDTQALDISSKFGTSLSRYQQQQQTLAIPSAAEISEKKARRARLAQEHNAEEFISLNPSDPELDEDDDDNITRDESGRLILKPKDPYKNEDSRLVRDDEDIMENFDEFTEADGQILFGRKAESEAARNRKADMAAQIAEAEGASDSDSDASERERNEAFEAAQTKHGTYSSNLTSSDPHAASRSKTPPKISPLPTLDGVIERLRKQVADMQTSRMQKLQEMEALQREKIRLGEEEIRIQCALRETSEKFQLLRAEKGVETTSENAGLIAGQMVPDRSVGLNGHASSDGADDDAGAGRFGLGMAERRLDSLDVPGGATPMDTDSQEELGARLGLGN